MSEENVGFCGDEYWKQILPPGFRFAPTDVELLQYYLFRKVHGQYITPGVIHEADVYQSNPIHLPGVSDKDEEFTYFFTRRTQKYQKGLRSARSTKDEKGYWRMTSKQTPVNADENGVKWCVGKKNTLVYNIKTPKGQPDEKTNWIMHEFELDQELFSPSTSSHPAPQGKQFNDLIVCRIYKRHSKDERERIDEPKDLTNSLIESNPVMTHDNNGEPPERGSPKRKFEPADTEILTECDQHIAPPMAMCSNNVYGSHYEVQSAAIWGNMTVTNGFGQTSGTSMPGSSDQWDNMTITNGFGQTSGTGMPGSSDQWDNMTITNGFGQTSGTGVPGSSDQVWATVYQQYECVQNPHIVETQNSELVDQIKPDEDNPLEGPHNMATRRDHDELNNNNYMPLGYLPHDFYLDAISSGDWFNCLYSQPPPLSEQELLSSYMKSRLGDSRI